MYVEFLKIRYRGSSIATTFREIPLDDSNKKRRIKLTLTQANFTSHELQITNKSTVLFGLKS